MPEPAAPRSRRALAALGLVVVVVLVGVALAGGCARADLFEHVRPGTTVHLERWRIELPREAQAWRGAAFLEFEQDPEDLAAESTRIGLELEVEALDRETVSLPADLMYLRIRLRGSDAWVEVDQIDSRPSQYSIRDGELLQTLQPRIPERALYTWELPERIDPEDITAVRLRMPDEEFEAGGGAFNHDRWLPAEPFRQIVFDVSAVDPPLAPDRDDQAAPA